MENLQEEESRVAQGCGEEIVLPNSEGFP